jgi:uncharacterized protein
MSKAFHEGEFAVQSRAGSFRDAQELGDGMVQPRLHVERDVHTWLRQSPHLFFTMMDLPVVSGAALQMHVAADPAGGLATALSPDVIQVHAPLPLKPGVQGCFVSIMLIDFATRRRYRINGVLSTASKQLLVREAFGNCPKYIQARSAEAGRRDEFSDGVVASTTTSAAADATAAPCTGNAATGSSLSSSICNQSIQAFESPARAPFQLSAAVKARIEAADTAFLGSLHPTRGTDITHRGGSPGFIRVLADRVQVGRN